MSKDEPKKKLVPPPSLMVGKEEEVKAMLDKKALEQKQNAEIVQNKPIEKKQSMPSPDRQLMEGVLKNFGDKIDLINEGKINSIVNKIQDKLGADYISKNMDKLVAGVSQEINKSQSVFSYIKSFFVKTTIEIADANIDKIVTKVSPSPEELRQFKSDLVMSQGKEALREHLKVEAPKVETVSLEQKPKLTPPPGLMTPKEERGLKAILEKKPSSYAEKISNEKTEEKKREL